MRFEIRRVKNGIILEMVESPTETGEKSEIVYQEKYDEEDDVECFADFLRYLSDQYSPSTDRYSPKRIYIRVEPGDKYEPPQRKRRHKADS